jgi:hypothetical protein
MAEQRRVIRPKRRNSSRQLVSPAQQNGQFARFQGREVFTEVDVPGGCGQEITAVEKCSKLKL